MKKLLFIAIAAFSMQFSMAQDLMDHVNGGVNKRVEIDKNKVYNIAEIEVKPEFPGGTSEFMKYISKNFELPKDKDFKGGRVIASFVVNTDGSLSDIKILKDAGFGTGEEATRVLKNCKNWLSGFHNGDKVRCGYMIPIELKIL